MVRLDASILSLYSTAYHEIIGGFHDLENFNLIQIRPLFSGSSMTVPLDLESVFDITHWQWRHTVTG